MCEPNFTAIHPIVVQILNKKVNFMVELEVIRIHHLGTIIVPNFVTIHQVDVETYHSINENFDLLVVLEE